jgi:hypothetical protein
MESDECNGKSLKGVRKENLENNMWATNWKWLLEYKSESKNL